MRCSVVVLGLQVAHATTLLVTELSFELIQFSFGDAGIMFHLPHHHVELTFLIIHILIFIMVLGFASTTLAAPHEHATIFIFIIIKHVSLLEIIFIKIHLIFIFREKILVIPIRASLSFHVHLLHVHAIHSPHPHALLSSLHLCCTQAEDC